MSTGRYRLMWTFLADVASLVLSYVYGAAIIPWIGRWMWQPLVGLVGWLYEHFFLLLPLPHPLQAAYLSNPGVTWLTIALLFRLWYLVPWCQQLWFNVFGLYVSWPIRWINALAWPGYWDDRVEVADEFAFGVGQGYLLYTQIDEQIRQEEALKAERGVLAREIAHLKERLNVFQERATIRDWTVPGEDRPRSNYDRSTDGYTLGLTDDYGQGHFMKKWNELRQHLKELRGRDHQLEQLEATFRVTHPMLEERRGLLAAHLGSEQTWRERQGIASPGQPAALSGAQKLSGLASGTGGST
jgi:hypothetical protein